jgi:hypothetical protein
LIDGFLAAGFFAAGLATTIFAAGFLATGLVKVFPSFATKTTLQSDDALKGLSN